MSRFSAARKLGKHLDVDTAAAREILDDMGEVATRKGDEYVRSILEQPERAAAARAEGYRQLGMYGGGGALAGGTAFGGGLAYKGHADRQAAARAAQTEEEKLAIVADVLNDPSTSSNDKSEIIDAMKDAGVFNDPDSADSLWESIFGGNSLASGLSPIQAFGGGIGGWLIAIVLIWAAVQVWQDR